MSRKFDRNKMKVVLGMLLGAAFLVGLILAVILFNVFERQVDDKFEVTFTSPRQAVVFWQTDEPSVGYVKYGASKYSLTDKAEQTSSVPSLTHAVVINDVPNQGLFISVHTDQDSKMLWPKVREIQFDPTTIE